MVLFMVCALSLAVQVKSEAQTVSGKAWINSVYPGSVSIYCTGDGYYKDVQLLDYKKKVIKTNSYVNNITSFSFKKNRVYYFRWRYNDSYNKVYGKWSGLKKFTDYEPKMTLSTRSRCATIKVPKSKGSGITKVIIQASTKEKSGYKNIKTLKPGKKYKFKKFKKKGLKAGKTYYIRLVLKGKFGKCKNEYRIKGFQYFN